MILRSLLIVATPCRNNLWGIVEIRVLMNSSRAKFSKVSSLPNVLHIYLPTYIIPKCANVWNGYRNNLWGIVEIQVLMNSAGDIFSKVSSLPNVLREMSCVSESLICRGLMSFFWIWTLPKAFSNVSSLPNVLYQMAFIWEFPIKWWLMNSCWIWTLPQNFSKVAQYQMY